MSGQETGTCDYQYDIFFSYKRDNLLRDWVDQLHKTLALWVGEELQRPVDIFLDVASIETGQAWPDTLRGALRSSRCLFGVWSPLYFRSPWCMTEWESFLQREIDFAAELIVPITFHDGQHFPKKAKETEQTDCSAYASRFEVFWHSQQAVEFEKEIKKLASRLAKVIEGAPEYSQDFPVVAGNVSQTPNVTLQRLG